MVVGSYSPFYLTNEDVSSLLCSLKISLAHQIQIECCSCAEVDQEGTVQGFAPHFLCKGFHETNDLYPAGFYCSLLLSNCLSHPCSLIIPCRVIF